MADQRMEKLQEVMKDKQFAEELMALETISEIKDKFASVGIEFSTEEVEELVEAVLANLNNSENELNESALENVTGGGVIIGMAIFIGLVVTGVTIGWKSAGGCK